MDFEIIDFHAHPFLKREQNLCVHQDFCNLTCENTKTRLMDLGISKICGCVATLYKEGEDVWEDIVDCNESALKLREIYGDFYVPGIHIHPDFVKESCDEIERMSKKGVKLIGELLPYLYGWDDYSLKGVDEILDTAQQYNMVVSFHTMNDDSVDAMIKKHPSLTLVGAHPDEYSSLMRHIERFKMSENYYLDFSGTGIFRHGVIRRLIDVVGAERLLFGTDYPSCNPGMFIGGVLIDNLTTDKEKELIFSGNAKRLLCIEK